MRKALALIVIVLILAPVVSAGTIDGSVRFLRDSALGTSRTQELSLSIMAITSAADDLLWSVRPDLSNLVYRLIGYQNPDGGWGYFFNEPSNVIDTAYAVIALQRALPMMGEIQKDAARESIGRGVSYILSAKGNGGWGYVPETPSSCYPTLMALWALGETGHTYDEGTVLNALQNLDDLPCEIPEYEALGLKIMAYHSLGYPVNESIIEKVKDILFEGNVTVGERALLTYALVLTRPFDFDTYRLLTKLESHSQVETQDVAYWPGAWIGGATRGITAATAFALMALSTTYERAPHREFENPYYMPCDDLTMLQNPDGGWGVVFGAPSNEKATYYAVSAMSTCYPTAANIEKALNWTEKAFEVETEKIRTRGGMTYEYFYALETLLRYGLLSEDERKEAINLIKGSQLRGGLWGHSFLGPQPYDTALAVKALLDLGVPPNDPTIQKAKEWLLEVSSGGWGLYLGGYVRKLMFPDTLTTITVLEALDGIASPDELKPHIQWLLSQREDDGWSYSRGTPYRSLELTVRATDILAEYGYNYTNETLALVMRYRDEGVIQENTVDTSVAVLYLSRFQYVPSVTLYDVRYTLDTESFEIVNLTLSNESIAKITATLSNYFSGNFIEGASAQIGEDNYIVFAGFEDYPLTQYNPYLTFRVTNETVTVGNITVPRRDAIVVIPGKTPNGVVLFVLSDPGHQDIIEQMFTTGFIRYIRGHAMVLLVESNRIRLITVG
ncbi:hypothetical protein E3E36_06420 [Thermococcus sp. M36]|uniref:prenyltransferase/squalene oxidase repeat-containing protein n=1 Tax=Thermococcus sp. M36 TaxID=1638261 RepID=UPI0014386F08|nr:prenyltransferase/squalene oxidase repeat-containing protein [Thermococcus sp. M36]NJE05783.1 hypothetical protein [Thermococcus sp. M36]